MKLFLFTQITNYGEYAEIVCANNAEEAWNTSKAKTLNWTNNPQELIPTDKPSTIWEGGGDM